MAIKPNKSFRFTTKWNLIMLIILNLVLTPRSEDVQDQNRIEPIASVDNLISSSNETASSNIETGSIIDQDNDVEVEIEEVDIDGGSPITATGSGRILESSETTPASDYMAQEESNKNSSDPTAVAKVYDDAVPNYIAGSGATKEDKGGKGANNKLTRVKVACWDYRTMGVFNASTYNVNVTENTTTAEAEAAEESSSSTEEAEIAATVMIPDNSSEGDSSTEAEMETSPAIDTSNRTVELVNMTTLLHDILYANPLLKRSTAANCSVVMFYAPWCPFSAKAAPHYNALPRGYPPLRVAAIDSSKYKNVNTYFGILSVPTVVFFHNGKVIAKFNDTSFTLAKFAEFIEYFTDLKHEDRMNVTTKDFDGPLPSVPTKEVDWYLYIAWVFIIFCFFHYVSKSVLWRRAVDLVSTAWREAEAQHEHID